MKQLFKTFTWCIGMSLFSAMLCVDGIADAPKRQLDFSTIGVYGTLFDFCDFSVFKLIYFGKHRDPKRLPRYARLLEDAYRRGKLNLVGLYCFDRITHSRPIKEYIANADALLRALNLKHVYAVFLNEENVTWNNGLNVLNALYQHIKSRYTIPVYQWLTMPDLPHPKLRADGWIIDPYGFDRKRFRRYLMKYLVTGKPVINCITASPDPGAPFGITSQEQVDVCREFNVPMFFYCVDPKWGSPAVWLHSDDPAIAKCREWLLKVVDEAHRTDTTQLPLSTANYSTGQPIEVAGDENNRFVYLDDFSTLQFVDDATIRGFLNLRWDGIAESLSVEPRDQRVNSVQLIYHFQSEFEMYDMQAELSGELVSTSGVKTSLALSLNGWRWEDEQSIEIPKVTRRTARRLRKQPFTLISSFRNRAGYRSNEFWVRVQVELPQAYKRRVTKRKGLSKRDGRILPLVIFKAFKVSGMTVPPEQRAVMLKPDKDGRIYYCDNFASQKYLHLAFITNGENLRWQRGRLWIHGIEGRANRVVLRYKFTCGQPLHDIRVSLECNANYRDLGAWNNLAVSLDGKNKVAEVSTKDRLDKQGRFKGTLSIDLSTHPKFQGVRSFWVHIEMVSGSGKRTGASNVINALKIEAKVRGR